MSAYKIKVSAYAGPKNRPSEVIDLVDDWNYDSDEAAELYKRVSETQALPSSVESELLEIAIRLVGFDWNVSVVDA